MSPSLPDRMTVIEITEPGGPEKLAPAHRPLPQPATGELLIQVAAAGVNRPDCLQRQGSYPPPPGASDIPGLEVAGTVQTRKMVLATRLSEGPTLACMKASGSVRSR